MQLKKLGNSYVYPRQNRRGNVKVIPLVVTNMAAERFICPITGKEFSESEGVVLGAIVPQVKESYLCHRSAVPIHAESLRIFNETEQNCNTCKHLKRLPHDGELMRGTCDRTPATHPYKRADHFLFHPADWMGMECHEIRTKS